MANHQSSKDGGLFFLGLFIAIGLSLAGYFISNTLYKTRASENTASVKGLAEREVKSDLAIWELNFSLVGKNLNGVFADAKQDRQTIVNFLSEHGFDRKHIKLKPLSSSRQEYRDDGIVVDQHYTVNTGVILETNKVDKVVASYEQAGELIGRGVQLNGNYVRYLYTGLNSIKPEMLGEATRNARLAAEQFANDAGSQVGNIKTASQGSFSIQAKNSTGSYGEDETSLYKNVRVVTHITFYLK